MINYGQNTLFGKKIISSIGFDEQEMIRDILYLHAGGKKIDCDPTFSVGNFYKKGLKKPRHIYDKRPQTNNTIQATSENLPLENESINTIMFDPPFTIYGKGINKIEKDCSIMKNRFSAFANWAELKKMYSKSLKEFYRILKINGIVIFKCQDFVSGAKQHFTHAWVMYEALKYGFYPKDLFILLAKNRLTDKREQQHARKYHSYFWVFKKNDCKVNYQSDN